MSDQQQSNNRTSSPFPTPINVVGYSSQTSINVDNLGFFLDGWADLIEGMGNKVDDVRKKVLIGLQERNMPEITVNDMNATVGITSTEHRRYTITATSPGATTTIYVGEHGKDLYTSWRTFIRPVPNWKYIAAAAGIAAFIGLVASELRSMWTFFSTTIVLMILEFGLMAIAGRVMKGNYLAYFFIEPTVFDAEDITAMSLTAHKTLLRSLDSSGIDVSKLRLKQNFKGGRRDEMV